MAPALRVGWLVIPDALVQTLTVIKEASDINMNSFAQWVGAEFLEMVGLPSHLDRLREKYGARRHAMNSGPVVEFPRFCRWQVPRSGIFLWAEMPEGMIASDILKNALDLERVAFLPAEAFSRGQQANGMRLNFSRCNSELLFDGIRRIASAM